MKFLNGNMLLKTTLITVVLSCMGFGLLELELVPYGVTLFCVMPVLIGYIIGQFPTVKITLYFGVLLGSICFLFLLVIGGLESIFCSLTLFPFLMLLFFIGMSLGFFVKKQVERRKKDRSRKINVYIVPVLVLILSGTIEHFFTDKYTRVEVETKVVLPYSRDTVFSYVRSFDTLNSPKPFVFNIGIQTPLKCKMDREGVGAKRTCYFKEGTIDEIVTAYEPGNLLRMNITRYNMPGRKWLHFREATYLFTSKGDSTEVTRITTYDTELKPRFYWSFWEQTAIRAEHEYVLADLRRRLAAHRP